MTDVIGRAGEWAAVKLAMSMWLRKRDEILLKGLDMTKDGLVAMENRKGGVIRISVTVDGPQVWEKR
jgi:hypothetical protein